MVQLGTFAPILRLHSAADQVNTKEPWRFGEVAQRVMTRFPWVRHRLLPLPCGPLVVLGTIDPAPETVVHLDGDRELAPTR